MSSCSAAQISSAACYAAHAFHSLAAACDAARGRARETAKRLMTCLNEGDAEEAAELIGAEPRLAWVRDGNNGGFPIHVAIWQARPARHAWWPWRSQV